MLVYGKDRVTEKLQHVRSVDNGLQCKCVCPECGTELVAHQGNKKEWHFKHSNEGLCIGAVESSLHIRAKEILAEAGYIHLPFLRAEGQANSFTPDLMIDVTKEVVKYNQKLLVDDAKCIERTVNSIRPDLILYKNGHPLLVEIAVTHFIDAAKFKKIKDIGISCIEIDLSQYKEKELPDAALVAALTESSINTTWIYNAKVAKAEQQCQDEADLKLKLRLDELQFVAVIWLQQAITKDVSVCLTNITKLEKKDKSVYSAELKVMGSCMFNTHTTITAALYYDSMFEYGNEFELHSLQVIEDQGDKLVEITDEDSADFYTHATKNHALVRPAIISVIQQSMDGKW